MLDRPALDTALRHWPWVVIRFRCDHCRRGRDARLAACAEKYGADYTIAQLLAIWRGACPREPGVRRKPQKYGTKCTGYIGDLGSPPPPDLPDSLRPLRIIRGGRD